MGLARLVAQPPAADERGRAAAVEVQRLDGAERDERLGQLAQREAGLVVGPAVAGDGEQPPVAREPERGARVAPGGDVGVELAGARREALRVARHDAAAVDEQRPGLEQVAGGRGRQRVAPVDRHARARDVHAGPHGAPRRVEGDARRG